MALVSTVFSLMEVLDRELQLGSGEVDVTRGLAAYNAARRAFEALVALHPNVLGSATADVTTTANTETSSAPARFLRFDALWYVDPSTSRPSRRLDVISEVGGHTPNIPAILTPYLTGSTTGTPVGYYTNGTNLYWSPLPSGTHTVRCYGFQTAVDATASSGTFPYPDIVINPMAAYAVRLLKTGVDDPIGDVDGLATQMFAPVILALSRYQRDRAPEPVYRDVHDC